MFRTLFLLLIVASVSVPQNIQKLTIDDVIKIALEKSTLIRQTKNTLSSTEYSVKAAVGNFLPTVSASGGFRWQRSEQDAEGVIPSFNSEQKSFSAGISGNWNLFDGLSNIANLNKSKNEEKSLNLTLERYKQDIVFQTTLKFYNVIKFQRLLNVQEENLKWNKKSLETIIEKNKVGQLPVTDVYQQEVDYGNAELQLIETRNSFLSAKNDLVAYLFLDINKEYEFIASEKFNAELKELSEYESDFLDFNDLVKKALENRYDLQSKKFDILSGNDDITIARSGHLPSLTGFYDFSSSASNISNLFKSRNYLLGLSLNIPVFNGWLTSTRVQISEVNLKNLEIQLEDKERQIKVDLKKAYLDYEAAKKRLDVSNKNVLSAELNRKYNEEKYNLGSGTLLNLLIANSNYVNAQSLYVNASIDFEIQKKQLKYLMGSL